MIFCVFQYERQNFEHLITPSDSLDMMIARFIASIMMHINVEQDVKQGITMMKYATNHWREFNNPMMPFITGLLSTLIALIIEFNVMIILSALPDLLGIIVRYVSLASIAKVPQIYFGSLSNMNISEKLKDKKLNITQHRHDNPLKDAPLSVHVMRYIYKVFRIIFCSVLFYFTPFATIFLNAQFMVGKSEHTHIKGI